MHNRINKKIALVAPADTSSFPHNEGILRYFFSKSRPSSPKRLLLTTFHMDVEFIFDEVLNQVPHDCKTAIFYSPFSSNIIVRNSASERDNIRFVKARTRVFHPKFMLAVSGANALVGLGSANLTKGGWGGRNQELWHVYGRLPDTLFNKHIQPLRKDILVFCQGYLDALMRHEMHTASTSDREMLKDIKRLLAPPTDLASAPRAKRQFKILHNYDSSFLNFLKGAKIGSLKHIHIFSPIHFRNSPSEDEMLDGADGEPPHSACNISYELFRDFAKLFPSREKAAISFYSSDDVDKTILVKNLRTVQFFKNTTRSHLKAMIFETAGRAYMLSGSANFSINAIKKGPYNGGNSEIMLFEDITGKWPRVREVILGRKFEEQQGVELPQLPPNRATPNSVIDCMEVSARKKSIEIRIYSNLKPKEACPITIEYAPYLESDSIVRMSDADIVRLPKITMKGQVTEVPFKGRWKKLIFDRPLFCFDCRKSIVFSFPVHYDLESDRKGMTDAEKAYSDLFRYFGFKWNRRRPNPRPWEVKKRGHRGDTGDDAESVNPYQSINDKFFYDWKQIYKAMSAYRKKGETSPEYIAARGKIMDFLDSYEEHAQSPADTLLTPVQVDFIRNGILSS